MPKASTIFLWAAILTGVIGFIDIGIPAVTDLGKPFGAVFFTLFYIFRVFGEEQEPGKKESHIAEARSEKRPADSPAPIHTPLKGQIPDH